MTNADRANTPDTAVASAPAEGASMLGRVLVMVYLILAIAATMRALYQLLTKPQEALLAYSLSLLSGVVYIVATFALMRSQVTRATTTAQGVPAQSARIVRATAWRTLAWVALSFELIGVLVVGTLSLTHAELFAHPSVWSWYGSGYLFIPLILPILGMLWLLRDRNTRSHPMRPQLP